MSMTKLRSLTRPALPLFALAVFALLGLPEAASAQSTWTTSGNDISNTNTGNVGVGTAAPAHKLDVAGNVNAAGLCLGSTCKTSWAEISGTSSQWMTAGTSIYYTGGNVGIGAGMTAPHDALMVNGKITVNRSPSPGPAEFRIYNGGSVAEWAFRQAGATSHNLNISKGVSGTYTDYLTIDTAGHVGVGTSAPAQKLHVLGGNIFHQFNSVAGQEYGFYTSISNNHLTSNAYFDGQWRVMTAGRAAFISTAPLDDTGGSSNAFSVYADNTPRAAGAVPSFSQYMVVKMGGNVGIGTSTPGARLDVGAGAAARGLYTDLLVGAGGNNPQLELYGATKSTAIAHDEALGGLVFYTNGPAFAPSLFVGNVGNVGVGMLNPAHKLDVAGNVNASGLCLGGDCKTSWSQAVGTPNQWTTAGTSIYYTGGNVGIGAGMTAPHDALMVNGKITVNRSPSPGPAEFRIYNGGSVAEWAFRQAGATSHNLNISKGVSGTYTDYLTIDTAGHVGVGTSAPAARLHVAGDIKVDGNINAKYQDVAEWVPSRQKLSAGTVVVLDPERPNHVLASTSSYDTAVAGVISEKPGLSLGEAGEGKALVATTGRVKVRVDATRVPIKIGDLIVTSDVEGAAMKSQPIEIGGRRIHSPGTIIGKALEPLEKGVGEILVLLSLQ